MSNFQLVLFDLDDTLVYFCDYWEASAKDAFRYFRETRDLNTDELFEAYRKHDLDLEQLYLRQEITVEQYRIERITRTLRDHGREIAPEFALTFEDRYKTFSRIHIKPNEEITKTLQLL
ncbi:HAD family hydrolase [Paenibacillus sp. NPDC057967]|uniref:HAD family hydrolase n=1 Tax=Paenibacillus sp. NPDC057967 TaxID=3346293 RepID=UPI0036DA7D5D